jgi:hypothetical protein
MATADAQDEPLKRLGGGRWRSRDERFTIEPQSGTWVVVDGEQVDDLGLPLVRGPFGSLRDAKAAMTSARASGAASSPLAGRRPAVTPTDPPRPAPARSGKGTPSRSNTGDHAASESGRATSNAPAGEGPDPEPRWLSELSAADRRRARRLIARVEAAGASDGEGMTRRDIVGDVPSIASFAVRRRLADLGPDASSADVVRMLVEGRDDDLDVRWRLVDGHGRPISDLSG